MDELLVRHMIRNCFYQYHYTKEALPLSESDYARMLEDIQQVKREQPETELYEIIEDLVYEFITNTSERE